MSHDDLIDQVSMGLRSVQWQRPGHRAALRERVLAGEPPARRIGPGRRELVVAALVIIVLGSAGTAAWRVWRHYGLRGTANGKPTEFLLPVDEDGNVKLNFIDEDGETQTILITPDMIDENGTIRGMNWNLKDEPEQKNDE